MMWIFFGVLSLAALVSIALRLIHKPTPIEGALLVEHFPNPTDAHTSSISQKPPFPYVWFYRTEVTNKLDKPLKIVRFESYFWVRNRWAAANVLRRPLTTEVFLRWYGDGEGGKQDGWLQPGTKAVCDINWHGFYVPYAPKAKWVFYAVDEQGSKYQGEGELISVPYETETHQLN